MRSAAFLLKQLVPATPPLRRFAAVKNSAVLVIWNMAQFLSRKIENIRGGADAGMLLPPIEGPGPSETVVPRALLRAPAVSRFGSVEDT